MANAKPKPPPQLETPGRVAFQGLPGAYSDLACRDAYPEWETLPCPSFEDVFQAVEEKRAALAMIPVENSIAGRVADIHQLLPHTGLHIVAEHFQRVNHVLLAAKGASLETLRSVHSHVHALSQCRRQIRELGLLPIVHADTAGAAQAVAEKGDPEEAAIASRLAGEIYGLETLRTDIEDAGHNTTRFLVLASEPRPTDPAQGPVITSFIFRVRNVPAALYKALGGFATNGINMTKIESYMGPNFSATRFYADVDGHPSNRDLRLALEELGFFSHEVKILGVYPAHPFRRRQADGEDMAWNPGLESGP